MARYYQEVNERLSSVAKGLSWAECWPTAKVEEDTIIKELFQAVNMGMGGTEADVIQQSILPAFAGQEQLSYRAKDLLALMNADWIEEDNEQICYAEMAYLLNYAGIFYVSGEFITLNYFVARLKDAIHESV